MENLLAMPVTPLEVMIGKLLPFIDVGLVQVTVIIGAALLLFGVPMLGSPLALATGLLVFIAANLAMGFLFSTLGQEPAAGDADVVLRFLGVRPSGWTDSSCRFDPPAGRVDPRTARG